MAVVRTSRTRARTTRGAGLLAAGFLLATLNSPSPVAPADPPLTLLVDRQESPSRSHPDRLDVQSGMMVPQDVSISISTATASARDEPPEIIAQEDGPICISSPLEPGTFTISSSFGNRINPIDGLQGLHAGVDLATSMSSPIYAVADGVVTYTGAGQAGRSAELVIIDHEIEGLRFSSWYVHMYPHGVFVEAGQKVRAGEHIADVGSNGFSTGPHLHFEIHTPLGGTSGGGMAVGALLSTSHDHALDEADPDADESTETEENEAESPQQTSEEDESSPTDADSQEQDEEASLTPESDEEAEPNEEPSSEQEPSLAEDDPDTEAETDSDALDASEDDPTEEDPTTEDLEEKAESAKKEPVKFTPAGSDFEITIEDDQGQNDHTIRHTVSRTTGFFDAGSLGMVHDPIPFLEALGYGILTPSMCSTPVD